MPEPVRVPVPASSRRRTIWVSMATIRSKSCRPVSKKPFSASSSLEQTSRIAAHSVAERFAIRDHEVDGDCIDIEFLVVELCHRAGRGGHRHAHGLGHERRRDSQRQDSVISLRLRYGTRFRPSFRLTAQGFLRTRIRCGYAESTAALSWAGFAQSWPGRKWRNSSLARLRHKER